MTAPIQGLVPVLSPAANPVACVRPGCAGAPSHSFVWPNRPQAFACDACVPAVRSLAQRAGVEVDLRPLAGAGSAPGMAASPASVPADPAPRLIVRTVAVHLTEPAQAMLRSVGVYFRTAARAAPSPVEAQAAEFLATLAERIADGPDAFSLDPA